MIAQIESAYADKRYDSKSIRKYPEDNYTVACIPHRESGRPGNRKKNHVSYHKVHYVVERFFSWLKNGYHRTRIRYERKSENYLGFVYLVAIRVRV